MNAFLQFLASTALLAATSMLCWIFAIILLNVRRHHPGVWFISGLLASGGWLCISDLVFAKPDQISWHQMWIPGLALPLLWYLIIRWYTGLYPTIWWRRWLLLCGVCIIPLLLLIEFASPIWPHALPLIAGLSRLVFFGWPVIAAVCIQSALILLARPPAFPDRVRNRALFNARPRLQLYTRLFLATSLLAWIPLMIVMIGPRLYTLPHALLTVRFEDHAALINLAYSVSIICIVYLMGMVVSRHEFFIEGTLPRHRLVQHWHTIALLSIIGSLLALGMIQMDIPILLLLASIAVVGGLGAGLVYRVAYMEGERQYRLLRPMMESAHVYEAIRAQVSDPTVDLTDGLKILCETILHAPQACLMAAGPLVHLVRRPLRVPENLSSPLLADIEPLSTHCRPHESKYLTLDIAHFEWAQYAIPLWNGERITGFLLLGEKADGECYTHEEFQLARAHSEHLLDLLASARVTQMLMELMRARSAERAVTSGRPRRILHDEIAPKVHRAYSAIEGERLTDAKALLIETHKMIADLLHDMRKFETLDFTSLTLCSALKQLLDIEYVGCFTGIRWDVNPEVEKTMRRLSPPFTETVYYALREAINNAARHGRGGDPRRELLLTISGHQETDMIVLCVEDNGVGAQFESASTEKGCGQGLELHHAMLAAFNTEMHIESVHGQHTRVILSIPLSVVDWCTETLESQYAFQPVGAVTPDEDRETALNSHVHEMDV